MKLTKETLDVLKNFTQFNSGMKFSEGKTQRTISMNDGVLVECELTDDFPKTFFIYDVNQFLGTYESCSDGTELRFDDEAHVKFVEPDAVVNYRLSAEKHIKAPPNKSLPIPKSFDAEFEINESQLNRLQKFSKMYDLPDLRLKAEDGKISIEAFNLKDNSKSTYVVDIAPATATYKEDFECLLKTENLQLLNGTYKAHVSLGNFVFFKHTTKNIKYWVAIEEDSE